MFALHRIVVLVLLCLMSFAAHAADGDFLWARGMGGASDDAGTGIAVDSAGNVYTSGSFWGTVDFDPGADTMNLTSAGWNNIFVQKLDASGNLVWARGMGGMWYDEAYGIAVDSAGNVYTTGEFWGTADFDPGPGTFNLTSAGISDIFVQKLDASGNLLWARGMGGTERDTGNAISVDGAGNVYTTGFFQLTADFDPGEGTFNLTSAGWHNIFVQKLDPSGSFVWARHMVGTSADIGHGIAVDGAGNVYTTGDFQRTTDFDPGAGTVTFTSAGQDIFVQKLDTSGNLIWARSMGGTGGDVGYSIAVDSAGNVYTTGIFVETADFDPGPGTFNLTSAGISDIFVQKLDASGNLLWARGMGGTERDSGTAISVDGAGNVYTTGFFQLTADFDPGAGTVNLTSAGDWDIFVQKLDASGYIEWTHAHGGTDYDIGLGISVDGPGNIYTTGRFENTADFDPGAGTVNFTSAGRSDIFVQKLRTDATRPDTTAIVPETEGPTNAESVGFTVTFNEAVQNFNTEADLVLNHSSTASTGSTISGGPSVYTVLIDGITGDGSFTLAVNSASDVQDLAGTPLATSVTSAAVTIDNTPPTVSIGAPSVSLANSGTTTVFPVSVSGAGSINLTGGEVTINHRGTSGGSVVVVDGTSAMPVVQVSGVAGDGSYTIGIAAGIASDLAGNASMAAGPSAPVTVDNSAPTLSIGAPSVSLANSGTTTSFPVSVTGADSINLTGELVTIHHRGTSGGSVVVVDGTSAIPVVHVSGVTGDGSYRISIAAGIATDLAGNASLVSGPSASVSVDNTVPTVSISPPSASLVNRNRTVTFPVTVGGSGRINLRSSDVSLQHDGTAGGSVVVLDRMTVSPKVQVTGVTGDGSFRIGIAAGIAIDAVGNASLETGPSAAVSVDNSGPVFANVVANPAEVSAGDTVSISFDSSEPVAGEPEVKVNGNPAVQLAKADYSYEYTVQSRDVLGAATITISAADALGNVGALGDSTLLEIVRAEGEGDVEGEGEGSAEGQSEGVDGGEGEGEGIVEGAGEGQGEGEGENPPAGCGGCNAAGGPMEKSLGDWLAAFLGLAVMLGAHLSLRSRLET